MLYEFYQIFKKILLTENKMSDINDFLKHLRNKDYFSVCSMNFIINHKLVCNRNIILILKAIYYKFYRIFRKYYDDSKYFHLFTILF